MIKVDGTVLISAKEMRQAKRSLTEKGKQVYALLEKFEQFGFVDPLKLIEAINNERLCFIAFSCLGTYSGKQELKLDLFETYFFRSQKTVRRLKELCRAIQDLNVELEIRFILPDLEPRRTWGWQVEQDELTLACKLMASATQEEEHLPADWQIQIWSDIECQLLNPVDFDEWVAWARENQVLMVSQVENHLRQFLQIEFVAGLRESAVRQVAAYALEGWVLEQLFPNAILLQSEQPFARKDRMYQLKRKSPLPIIHPFIL